MNARQNTFIKSLVLLAGLFAILGFAAGVNAFFIPFIKDAFQISTGMSYMVLTATYLAFILFGIPSGFILEKMGYKGGIAIGLILIGCGFFIIACAGKIVHFYLFLLALFISGMGQTLLTGAQSTYVVIMGPRESALKRGGLMGVCHKTFFAGASLILSRFMDLTAVQIEDIIIPFYILSIILVFVGVITFFAPLPEINEEIPNKNIGSDENTFDRKTKTSIFQFPHLFLGFFALFFYIGAEFIALNSINDYATVLNLPSPANYVWLVSGGMVIGYIAGIIFTPEYISLRQALIICSFLGVASTIAIYIVPGSTNIYLVALLGLSNSLMYGAIWPLAIADLGKYTKTGTSILVMSITGGAVIPIVFGYLVDISSYRSAYLICLPIYLLILFYALYGYKIRKWNF